MKKDPARCDYGTDDPTIALSPQEQRKTNLSGSVPKGGTVLSGIAVLLFSIAVVLLVGAAASAWVIWGPK